MTAGVGDAKQLGKMSQGGCPGWVACADADATLAHSGTPVPFGLPLRRGFMNKFIVAMLGVAMGLLLARPAAPQ